MAKETIANYIRLVDILSRYGHLTREEINRHWERSARGDGAPLPKRTFFHYRRAIEDIFNITIGCDGFGRYYIEQESDSNSQNYQNWLLDSYAVNSALKDSGVPPGCIQVEDVPSARTFMPQVLDAISGSHKISFTYAGFNRSRQEEGILFSPWFLKRYKQRWYMVGMREKSGEERTYALDRVRSLEVLPEVFTRPDDISIDDIFGNIVGVTSSKAEVRTVKIQATSTQAKYLRALPLHESQQEEIHDFYSIFTYRLKLNYDLVSELLSFGENIKVLQPKELQVMITTRLREALNQYNE